MRRCELCESRYEPEKDYFVLCDTCYQKSLEPTSQEVSVAIAKRYALFDFRCCYCSVKEVQCWDHVIPRTMLSRYLANRPLDESFRLGLGSNLVPACTSCNSAKSNRDLVYFYTHQNWEYWGAGGLSRLRKIVSEHLFAPAHWALFIEALGAMSLQGAWREVEERSRAWQGRFSRASPICPFPVTPTGRRIGDTVYHDTFGRGVITDFVRDARSDGGAVEMLEVWFSHDEHSRDGHIWLAQDALKPAHQPLSVVSAPNAVICAATGEMTKFPTPGKASLAPTRRRSPEFQAGDRVRHPKFGKGVVITSILLKNGYDEVTVAFPGDKPKKLLASFANLQKVEA